MCIRDRLECVLRKMPFLSGLPDCTKEDHKDASRQMMWTLLGSTLPIWLGTFVVFILKDAPSGNILEAFMFNISGGELFIYSTSALAPVFYMALYERPGIGAFPSKTGHIITVVLFLVISSSVFALLRSGVELRQQYLLDFSLLIYVISVILLYLATVYHSARHSMSPSRTMRSQEQDFTERLRTRRAGRVK